MEDITLTINGKKISCQEGTSILNVAEEYGIKIPTLCHHHDLEPFGACRLCLVEEEKTGRLMASCVTPVAQDMVVLTESPRIEKHRRNIVRLMMAEHPESCVVCNKGNRCQLRQIAAQLDVGETDLYPIPNYKRLEQANPFIVRDLSKCILCGKCIRADHELVVVGAIDYSLRGFRSRPATVHDLALEQSSCTFCGTCVSMCPTGALAPNYTRYIGTPEKESLSICGFCGVGCSLTMGVAYDHIVEVNPSHRHNTVNGSTLCVRGHFAHDFLNTGERLQNPMIRKNGELISASWEEVLGCIADKLLDIKKESGPRNIAFLGSSKCTNEENYLFQKIARVLLETNNVDNGGYISGQSLLKQIDDRTQGEHIVQPLSQIEGEEAVFVLGADPGQSAPVVSYHLKRAAKKGIPLIVADPRRTELVGLASIWLPITPESDLELINSLAALLYYKKAYDPSFIDRFTKGFDMYRDGIYSLNLGRVSSITGIDMSAIERTAELLQGKKIAFVIGHGILQQRYGPQILDAIMNLSLMMGGLGPDGAGLYIIPRENNQMGARDMGTVPYALPGRGFLDNAEVRNHWERSWNVKIPSDHGLNMVQMIEEAEKGNLKALYIMGENPLRSLPQPHRVRKAMEKIDFIVAQDIIMNETISIADAVLPGVPFCEKDGSFTNLEGRIQTFAPVVAPSVDAKPDWEILGLLLEKMGHSNTYNSLEDIRTEIAQFVPMYEGLKGKKGMAWVKGTSGDGPPIPFSPVVSTEDKIFDETYPFTGILGSLRYHLGSGTRTSRSNNIGRGNQRGEIEISFEDGNKLDLHDGDIVRITSQNGSIEREIRLERGLRAGMIFVPMAFHGNDAMNLIGLTPLGNPDSSSWKSCQVKIEKS